MPRVLRINGKLGMGGVRPIVAVGGEAWTDDRGHVTYVLVEESDARHKRLMNWADRLPLGPEQVAYGLGGGPLNTHKVPAFLYALSAHTFRIGLPGGAHWKLDDLLRDVMRFPNQKRRVEVARAVYQLINIADEGDMPMMARVEADWLDPIRAAVSDWLYDEKMARRAERSRWR